MAIKPTEFPRWAQNEVNDPITGAPNKEQPSPEFQNEGLDRHQPLPRDHVNYQFNLINNWLEYLDGVNSTVTQNITIYVSPFPIGNDTTGDGTISNPFATPHKALDSMIGTPIATNALVTIYCSGGVYSFTEPLIVNHPYGERIHIIGQDLVGTQPTRAPIADWTDKAIPVVPARQPDELYNSAGTAPVAASQAARTTRVGNDLGNNKGLLRARYATQFEFSGCSGLKIQGNNSLGLFDKILLVGDWDGVTIVEDFAHGIESGDAESGESAPLNVTGGTAYVGSEVAVVGFQGDGYRARYGGVIGCRDGVISCNNMAKGFSAIAGVVVANGSTSQGNIQQNYFSFGCGLMRAQSAFSTGSVSNGFHAHVGSVTRARDAECYGNFTGMLVTTGSACSADNLISVGNGTYGVQCGGGFIDADNANISDNGTGGIYVTAGGHADHQSSIIENNGTLANVYASIGGTANVTLSTIQNGDVAELIASGDGMISAASVTMSSGNVTSTNRSYIFMSNIGGLTFSPAYEVIGNNNSIIGA